MKVSFFNGTDITEAVSRPGVADLIHIEQIVSAGGNRTDFKVEEKILLENFIVEKTIPLGVTDELITKTRYSFCYGRIKLVPEENQGKVFGLFTQVPGGQPASAHLSVRCFHHFNDEVFRPFHKGDAKAFNVRGRGGKRKPFINQCPVHGFDILDPNADVMVAQGFFRRVVCKLLVGQGQSEVDRGAAKVEHGAVGLAKPFFTDKFRAEIFREKFNGGCHVSAYQVNVIQSTGHIQPPFNIFLI